MTLTLDKLPQELFKQHGLLWITGGHLSATGNPTSVQEYSIDSLGVNLLVNMELVQTKFNKEALRGVVRCEDIVSVTINPPNEKVEDVVKHHFKSQMMPQTVEGVVKPRFAEIVINGTKV